MQTHSHTRTSDIELVPNRTRRFRLAEEDAGAEHEGEVDDYVDQVHQHRAQRLGRRQDVVGVEKLDVVASVLAAVLDRLDRQVEAKPRK